MQGVKIPFDNQFIQKYYLFINYFGKNYNQTRAYEAYFSKFGNYTVAR